jgi:hypothetical protein
MGFKDPLLIDFDVSGLSKASADPITGRVKQG